MRKTLFLLSAGRLAMSRVERQMGRLMRAPDGHEGGEGGEGGGAGAGDGDGQGGGGEAVTDFSFLPPELVNEGAIDPGKLKAHMDGLAPRAADLPASADAYQVDEIEGIDPAKLKESPLFQHMATAAHSVGMGQAQFSGFIKDYAAKEIARSTEAHKAELAALGENAEARISSVANWLASKVGQEEADALQGAISTAAGVRALEKLMGNAPAPRTGEGEPNATEDDEETIKKLQASPEYYDRKKRDPKVVERVQAFYAKRAAGAKK